MSFILLIPLLSLLQPTRLPVHPRLLKLPQWHFLFDADERDEPRWRLDVIQYVQDVTHLVYQWNLLQHFLRFVPQVHRKTWVCLHSFQNRLSPSISAEN